MKGIKIKPGRTDTKKINYIYRPTEGAPWKITISQYVSHSLLCSGPVKLLSLSKQLTGSTEHKNSANSSR